MKRRIGLGLANFPFSDARAFWRWVERCEDSTVDSIWQTDRLVSPVAQLESMTTMAALAGATRRLKFGMNVTVVAFRDPLVLARECATIDFLSNGRLLPAFGVGPDYVRAAALYRAAAEQGDGPAQDMLSSMLLDGEVAEPDPAEAQRWALAAAEQGMVSSMTRLGKMFHDALGVDRDPAEAARWWRRAAERGDADGQTLLGAALHLGAGVTRDERLRSLGSRAARATTRRPLRPRSATSFGTWDDRRQADRASRRRSRAGDHHHVAVGGAARSLDRGVRGNRRLEVRLARSRAATTT
jgi:hypothetical protein